MNEKELIRKKVLKLAVPIILEQVATILLGIINTIMVGRLGKESVAAVGNVDMLSRCVFPLFAGIATGVTILIAHAVGQKQNEEACDISKQGLYAGTILSVVLMIILIFARNYILDLLFGKAEESVMVLARKYFRITIFSYPFMFIYYLINGVLRGSGETKTPLKVTVIMNIVNVVFGYLMIYGIHIKIAGNSIGLDGLGVIGAAIGITAARACGAILDIIIIIRGKHMIHIAEWYRWKYKPEVFSKIIRIGVPYGMEQFAMQTGKLVLQVLITSMGTVAIAANTIGMSIMSLCITLGYGFNLAAVTLTGQAIGAGKPEDADRSTKEILKLNIITLSVISALIIIFVPQICSIYTTDTDVINCGVSIIRIYAFSQPFLAIVQVLGGSLRGAGDTKYPMVTTFLGVWCLRLLFGFILGKLFNMGINGVWTAMTIDLVIRSIAYTIRYRRGNWKKLWIKEQY